MCCCAAQYPLVTLGKLGSRGPRAALDIVPSTWLTSYCSLSLSIYLYRRNRLVHSHTYIHTYTFVSVRMASLIVAGATGAVGADVVKQASRLNTVSRIVCLTRSASAQSQFSTSPHAIATTIDWEHLCAFWGKLCQLSPADEQQLVLANLNKNSGVLPGALHALQKDYIHYQAIFSGHHYAAICLGTTRSDAGGAEEFQRCDYTYVVTFIEALLYFSAVGWDVTGGSTRLLAYPREPMKTSSDYVSGRKEVLEELTAYLSTPQQRAAASFIQQRSSCTLKGVTLVSTHKASHTSMFNYLKTKGAAQEAVVERLIFQNTFSRLHPEMGSGIITLYILHPGLLDRGDKARWNEKVLNVFKFKKAMDVSLCASCIVQEFSCTLDGSGELLGSPYPNQKLFSVAQEPMYVLTDEDVRTQAGSPSSSLWRRRSKNTGLNLIQWNYIQHNCS